MLLRKSLVLMIAGSALAFQPGLPVGDRANDADRVPPAGAQPAFVLTQSASEAVEAALADIQKFPAGSAPFMRYVWIQDGEANSYKTLSMTMNFVSRASTINRPFPLMEQRLARIDLRQFWPRDRDLVEAGKLWEEFAFDPAFALLLTKDTIAFNRAREADLPKLKRQKQQTRRVVTPGKARTEKTQVKWEKKGDYIYSDDSGRIVRDLEPGLYDVELRFKAVDKVDFVVEVIDEETPTVVGQDVDVVRFNAAHLGNAIDKLQSATGSLAPIVSDRYLKHRLMTTIKDGNGVYNTIFGGRYHEARGIKKIKDVDKESKATDLDLFLSELGVGNLKAGDTADALFARLRSDQRLAIFRSQVTGKPREVSMFHTLAEKEGASWGAITGDVKDAQVDIGDRAFANLLTPKREAREAIFPTITGFPIFALFNAQGALQDEVPPDIAVDHTVPTPHTKRLQPAIGCIRCHGGDGSDGWKPLNNDVKRLLGARLDILGDIGLNRPLGDADTIDRLAGLYTGDFSKALRRARDDYAEAILKAAGTWREADAGQTDVVKVASARLADEFAQYNYDLVDARQALREIGIDVQADKALGVFADLVQPLPQDNGLLIEDARIAALRSGLGINRADFALAQASIAERVYSKLKAVKK